MAQESNSNLNNKELRISAEERRADILQKISLDSGKWNILRLARKYGVARTVIRKDLKALEKRGYSFHFKDNILTVLNMDLEQDRNQAFKIEQTDFLCWSILFHIFHTKGMSFSQIEFKVTQSAGVAGGELVSTVLLRRILNRLVNSRYLKYENGIYYAGDSGLPNFTLGCQDTSYLLETLRHKAEFFAHPDTLKNILGKLAGSLIHGRTELAQAVAKLADRTVVRGLGTSIKDVREQLNALLPALQEHKTVKFLYKSPNRSFFTRIIPWHLRYDWEKGFWYLFGLSGYGNSCFRLDRICLPVCVTSALPSVFNNTEDVREVSAATADEADLKYFQQETVFVRVVFSKVFDIELKVNEVVKRRQFATVKPLNDNYFLYEDVVVNLKDFQAWLRAFGRAAIVLEPLELQQEIIASAQRVVEIYEDRRKVWDRFGENSNNT